MRKMDVSGRKAQIQQSSCKLSQKTDTALSRGRRRRFYSCTISPLYMFKIFSVIITSLRASQQLFKSLTTMEDLYLVHELRCTCENPQENSLFRWLSM